MSDWFWGAVLAAFIALISYGAWRIVFLGYDVSHRYPAYMPFLLSGLSIWYAGTGAIKGTFGSKASLSQNPRRFWGAFALMSVFGIEMLIVGFVTVGR
jgi:hypothetical protein